VTTLDVTPAPEQETVPVGIAPLLAVSARFTDTAEPKYDSTGARLAFTVTALGVDNVTKTVTLPVAPP
jgi:hypothetical protein